METNFNLNYNNTSPVLPGICWKSEQSKAVLIIVHGMGEHIRRYAHFGKLFNENNISVLGVDLRGFGKAPGKKGHGVDINEMKLILKAKLSYAEEQFPNVPIIVFGQSMGGNIALNYQLTESDPRAKAYIAASPWIQTAEPLSPLLIRAASILSKIAPKVTKGNELDVKGISDLDNEVEKYVNDPLVHDRVSFGFGYSMFLSAEFLNQYAEGGTKVDTLLTHSNDDFLTSAKATKAFASRNPDKLHFLEKDGLLHELHNSSKQKDVLNEYLQWVLQKI